jgi:hypothetical protein
MDAIAPQALARLLRQGSAPRQFAVRLIVAGQQGKGDLFLPAHLRQSFNAVWPIALAAKHADDHQAGAGDGRLQPIIDR